jgi:hypothetical protein
VLFYDRAAQAFREQTFEEVETFDGHAFPTRIRVRNLLTGAESVLAFENMRVGADVPARVFEESVIQRRLDSAEMSPEKR